MFEIGWGENNAFFNFKWSLQGLMSKSARCVGLYCKSIRVLVVTKTRKSYTKITLGNTAGNYPKCQNSVEKTQCH